MANRSPRAPAFSFAQLLGGHAPRAVKAEDETDPKDKKEEEARKAKRAKAEDPDDQIADENDDPPAEDEGVDGDPKPDLGDVEDPDDSVDEDAAPEEDDVDPKMKKAAKSGRKAERNRWSKVMSHSSAAGRVATACQLLSSTSMDSRQIVAALKTVPSEASGAVGARGSLLQRMASRPAVNVGSDARTPGADDFGAQMAAAVSKVRGS